MSGTMRAYQLVRAGEAQMVELPIPEPGPGAGPAAHGGCWPVP